MRNAILAILFPVLILFSGCALYPQTKAPQAQPAQLPAASAPQTNNQPVLPAAKTVNMPAASAPAVQPRTITVSIAGFEFVPSTISVNAGDTVRWVNDDAPPHKVVADSPSNIPGLESGMLNTGDSFSFTFNSAGTFGYHCQVHPSMKGTIIVK